MPYLKDGRPVDMVFNPLGVPSRMNLGLPGGMLERHYRITPFDERYKQEASRKLPINKHIIYGYLNLSIQGKSKIFDGRTENSFKQLAIMGKPYILKLIHQVDDKLHGRSNGHYALVTQQPLRGREGF
ncbi:DNA-directed RNA polymerase subunit beta [Glycine soja]